MPMRRPTTSLLLAALLLGAAHPAGAQAESVPPFRALQDNRTVPESKAQVQLSFAPLVKRAAPSVVNVYGTHVEKRAANRGAMDEFLRRFFGDAGPNLPQERAQRSLGSGVIVDASGLIVTNNHVIENMNEVKVALNDRREFEAQILLRDPRTDLAILKIKSPSGGLTPMEIGDSEHLQVGDFVIAIGNPFGVGQTVTQGIVSALARTQVGSADYQFFIQTDAAINPGNSGGALVDTNGNLMGINTAIYSRSGGSMGIGFAIPANTAQHVMEGLVRDGQVTRGWIGIEPRDLTPEIAQTFNLPVSQGVLITGVLQDGPAGESGMLPGDVVLEVAGQRVLNTVQLLNAVAALKPQTQASFLIQRGKASLTLKITAVQRPKGLATARR